MGSIVICLFEATFVISIMLFSLLQDLNYVHISILKKIPENTPIKVKIEPFDNENNTLESDNTISKMTIDET
jgi:hypothetical protein